MSDYTQLLRKARVPWILLALSALLVCYYVSRQAGLPRTEEALPSRTASYTWPSALLPPAELWNVFTAGEADGPSPAEGPLAQRFRLAGTFFSYADAQGASPSPERRAIIDDLQKSQQYLVREDEVFEAVRVTHIYQDRVSVEYQGRMEDLWLSFAGAGAPSTPTATPPPSAEGAVLETGRFGKRIGENRWVFQREDLMKYYQEMLDDPERMAAIFLSMKPDYQDGRIAGYHVDMEGEKEFFRDVGLQQGDVVRKVNSMRMTSQARAEYFIGEFLKNRISAVVMEIEREGKSQKLIYLIR